MPVDVRGFNLDPQIGRSFSQGLGLAQQTQQIQSQNQQRERERQVREALGGASTPEFAPQTQQEQLLAEQSAGLGGVQAQAEQPAQIFTQEQKLRLAKNIDPVFANKLIKDLGLDSSSKRAEMSRFAAEIEAIPFNQRRQRIEQRVQRLRSEGRDPTQTEQLLAVDEDTQNKALLSVQLADLSTKERLTLQKGAELTAGEREFKSLTEGMTEKEKDLARRIDLGLEPRATARTAEREGDIAKAKADVDVEKEKRLEKELDLKRLTIAEKRLKIDESKFKTVEARNLALGIKSVRRNEADNAANVISGLLKNDRFASGFGKAVTATPDMLKSQEQIDVRSEIDQVVNLIGLEARQKLKGQGTVSDSEAKALAQSATILSNPLISDESARKELRRVRGVFENASARNQPLKITKEAEQPKPIIRFNRQGQRIQ